MDDGATIPDPRTPRAGFLVPSQGQAGVRPGANAPGPAGTPCRLVVFL